MDGPDAAEDLQLSTSAGNCGDAAVPFPLARPSVRELRPQVGIMITWPVYQKARGIKHCCQLAGQRLLSIEWKYDGKYRQVHIDLTRGHVCIKIFFKSGKDSTADRAYLQGLI
jgi:DNA ligase 4